MAEIINLKNIQAVVLDWDGTVVDSVPYKISQNQALAREFGNELSYEQVRKIWNASAGFPDLLHRLTGSEDMGAVMSVVRRDYNNPAYAKRNFDFGREALRAIRDAGYKTALITNATREILEMDAELLGISLQGIFDFTQTVDECEFKKPDARVFDPVIGRLGATASQMIYVGDEMKDYQAATNAGVRFIGVATGMTTSEEFYAKGVDCVDSLQVLTGYLVVRDRGTTS